MTAISSHPPSTEARHIFVGGPSERLSHYEDHSIPVHAQPALAGVFYISTNNPETVRFHEKRPQLIAFNPIGAPGVSHG